MSVIFHINTTNNKEVTVGLTIDGKELSATKPLDTRRAQVVLPLLEELLKEHKLTLSDLSGINVHTGPGSFTGIRVGITIANTLGYLLKIPVNGQAVGTPAQAVYAKH